MPYHVYGLLPALVNYLWSYPNGIDLAQKLHDHPEVIIVVGLITITVEEILSCPVLYELLLGLLFV